MTAARVIATVLIGSLVGCASPAASTIPSISPAAQSLASNEETEPASRTPTSGATPISTATSGPADGALAVPGFAEVVADALLMRHEPGLSGAPLMNAEGCIDSASPDCQRSFVIGTATGYVALYVFDGPINEDGYEWYLAATEMHTESRSSTYPEGVGWVAAGDDADTWLVSAPPNCPSPPVELADVTYLSMTRLEMLHCFGREQLTLLGWYPELPPGEPPASGARDACVAERGWLACYSLFDILRPTSGSWAGDADYLQFVVDPAARVTMPARSQWVEVTGNFDHPAATTCGDVAAQLICRSEFVVSSAVAP